MAKMVAEELARREVCARAKCVRTPQETPQMVTPTPEKPLAVVEADCAVVVFLEGAIRLTLIYQLTRFAYNYPLQAKTGKRVKEDLLLFLADQVIERHLVIRFARDDVCGKLVDQDDRKKGNRWDQLNIKATDRYGPDIEGTRRYCGGVFPYKDGSPFSICSA
ncbi:hypothetical protein AAG570_000971 [Ranatra chinensis]|uniref:Uncharacterized protein n=1 Tax=Ranatra chinensis TaxID=642074 RepID=A0ABD0YPE5_9HEMI